jgi:hypothetical protein
MESFLAWKVVSGIWGFWSKLPSSIKVLLIILLAFLGGFVWGAHKEKQKYEARIEQSITEAKRIDQAANKQALDGMQAEKDKWQKQALDKENKLSESASEYAKMKEVCTSNDKFIKDNDDIDKLLNPDSMSKQLQPRIKRLTPHR